MKTRNASAALKENPPVALGASADAGAVAAPNEKVVGAAAPPAGAAPVKPPKENAAVRRWTCQQSGERFTNSTRARKRTGSCTAKGEGGGHFSSGINGRKSMFDCELRVCAGRSFG